MWHGYVDLKWPLCDLWPHILYWWVPYVVFQWNLVTRITDHSVICGIGVLTLGEPYVTFDLFFWIDGFPMLHSWTSVTRITDLAQYVAWVCWFQVTFDIIFGFQWKFVIAQDGLLRKFHLAVFLYFEYTIWKNDPFFKFREHTWKNTPIFREILHDHAYT